MSESDESNMPPFIGYARPMSLADAQWTERIIELESDLARVTAERDALRGKVALAYGYLWHVNNEPYAPIPIYTPEKAAYEARKLLRDTLTSEQRGDAINAVQKILGTDAAAIDAARKGGS